MRETEEVVPQSTMELYCKLMTRVKHRILEARQLVLTAKDERAAVYAAIQLRIAIEEVAVASFVGNRPVLETLNLGISKVSWQTSRNRLKALNSEYWPTGVEVVTHPDGQIEWLTKENRITESEVPEIWGKLSSLLHARNPFREKINWREIIEYEKTLVSRLTETLNEHVLHLYDSDHLLCGQFWADPPHFYVFRALSAEDENTARNPRNKQS